MISSKLYRNNNKLGGSDILPFSKDEDASLQQMAVIAITQAPDINNNGLTSMGFDSKVFDQIGFTLNSNSFELPEGTYEINVRVNLNSLSNRSNFYLILNDSTPTEIDRVYGTAYARGSTDHNDTALRGEFPLVVGSPSTFSINTLRESGQPGDIVAIEPDSIIIIKRTLTKTLKVLDL